jgi:elongation factor G
MGSDSGFIGLIDLIKMKSYTFDGKNGETIVEKVIPERYLEKAKEKKQELIESLANLDPEIEDLYLNE